MRLKAMVALVFLLSGLASAQVPVAPMPVVHIQFLGTQSPLVGLPLAGGKLCTYQAGTTTPLATYVDSTGTSQNTNPVILDASGSANIWLSSSSYKFVLYDSGTDNTCSTGTLQWSVDNVSENSLLNAVVKNPSGSALQTIAGPLSLGSFAFTAGKINGTVEACQQNGADIGAQINGVLSSGIAIHICQGTHIVSTSIALAGFNNVRIFCDGPDTTILTSVGGTLGANPIFNLNGSSGTHISNVRIDGCTIRNGTANNTNFTTGMDGITAQYVDGLELDHFRVTNTQGTYAVQLRHVTRWHVHDFYLDTNTYCAFCQNSDNQYGELDHGTIDTLVCNPANGGNCPQTYAVQSGNDGTQGTNYSSDYWVHDLTVLNNPHWEAFDTHGGQNIFFGPHLRAVNVNNCVAAQIAATALITNQLGKNLVVNDVTCVQGTGDPDNVGVSIQGDGTTTKYYWDGYSVNNVKTTGFGSTASASGDTLTAFRFAYALHGVIQNSYCYSYNQNCIGIVAGVQDLDIINDHAIDLAGAFPASVTITGFLRFMTNLTYGVRVIGNSLEATTAAGVPATFVRAAAGWSLGGVIFKDNHINVQPTSAVYSNVGVLPVNKSTIPTTALVQAMGENVTNSQGQIGWTVCSTTGGSCNSTSTGYGSLDITDTVVTGNMTAGATPGVNNVFTVTGAGSVNGAGSDYRWVPIGMNVAICGAGGATFASCADGATDLLCQVANFDNSGTNPVLRLITSAGASCFASASVTGNNLKYQGLVYAAYSVDGNGNVVGTSFSAATFKVTNGAFAASIAGTLLTANRTQNLPDAAGTFLITGNGNSPIQTATAAGCATGAAVGAFCTTVVSWPTAFADTSYKAVCNGQVVTSGVPVDGGLTAKAAGSVTFQTVATTAAAAQFTNIACSAVHD